jgi:hypothetical protein
MKNVILILLFIPLSLFSQEKDAKYFNDYAIDSLWGVDNRLAIEYLNKAIDLDSLNPEYYLNRSNIFNLMDNQLMAIANINKAIKIDSSVSNYHYWKAVYSYYNEKDSISLNSINKALELDSLQEMNIFFKALILEQLGDYSNSKKFYRKLYDPKYSVGSKIIDKNIAFLEEKELNNDFTRNSNYYPYTWLEAKDTLNYPLEIGLEISLYDVKALKEEDNFFKADLVISAISDYPKTFIRNQLDKKFTVGPDTITITDASNYVKILSLKNRYNLNNYQYVKEFNFYEHSSDDISEDFFHKWRLRDFPFDSQELKIPVLIELDSSIVNLNHFINPITNEVNKNIDIRGLDDGYKVEDIFMDMEYINSGIYSLFSANNRREVIYPLANFNIVVSRSGSWLFIKLFLGTFLAIILSLSNFFINKRNFGSRIDVSVGALFVCVGNKYFVESVTPMVQVLTKADIINNISLTLIIFNLLVIIGQYKPEIKIGKFEDSKYALRFSIIVLVIMMFITLIV